MLENGIFGKRELNVPEFCQKTHIGKYHNKYMYYYHALFYSALIILSAQNYVAFAV